MVAVAVVVGKMPYQQDQVDRAAAGMETITGIPARREPRIPAVAAEEEEQVDRAAGSAVRAVQVS
jgi:hypothetical protein